MTANLIQPEMVSASQLARKIDVPLSRLLRGVHGGAIQPTATVMDGRLFLFDVARVEEIRDRINTLSEMPEETPIVA